MHQEYAVAFFDILGFKQKSERLGLSAIEERYRSLIAIVDRFNANAASLFGELSFKESAYWTTDGDVFILNRISGAYASDSIVVWTPSVWPEALSKSAPERERLARDPESGWLYAPIPCDNLLNICNELICRSIELGLPFRGALSMGPALFDAQRSVFLGQPLIDAATLERGQSLIGASLCTSFTRQTIPLRFLLPCETHIKAGFENDHGGMVLDWPRHWRRTRTDDPRQAVDALARDAGPAIIHYDNTRELIALSERHADRHESPKDLSIRSTYPVYANPKLKTPFRAIRRSGPGRPLQE
jgi:hypothetical protein